MLLQAHHLAGLGPFQGSLPSEWGSGVWLATPASRARSCDIGLAQGTGSPLQPPDTACSGVPTPLGDTHSSSGLPPHHAAFPGGSTRGWAQDSEPALSGTEQGLLLQPGPHDPINTALEVLSGDGTRTPCVPKVYRSPPRAGLVLPRFCAALLQQW